MSLPGTLEGQKRASDTLGLEVKIQVVVSLPVSAGNKTLSTIRVTGAHNH